MRLPPIVNQTMNTASSSATSTSMKNQTIAELLPNVASAAVVAVCAACSTLPQPVPQPRCPRVVTTETGPRAAAAGRVPGASGLGRRHACRRLARVSRRLRGAGRASGNGNVWREPCAAATAVDPRDAAAVRAFFEQHFTAYQALAPDGQETGLVTGYYEPLLNGSRVRSARNRYPLYAPPDDLLTIDLAELYPELKDKRLRGRVDGRRVVPYWPRADIDAGKAPLAGKELVFVDDPVEAFFLQIQGSGRVQLAEGGVMRVGYADQNGQPFRSIARVSDRPRRTRRRSGRRCRGSSNGRGSIPTRCRRCSTRIPATSSFAKWRPDPAAAIDGPIGALGVPLAAGRTIAVDPRSIPLGAPVFLATTWPLSTRPLNRLVLAQDTGGAIRGPLRADFFWGFGEDAAREAGRMKQAARLWLLWPKDAPLPR